MKEAPGGTIVPYARQLRKAAKRFQSSPGQEEAIHRLRIASRRLETFFRLSPDFEEIEEDRNLRRIFRKNRKLRKRLAAVRDLDVHIRQWNQMARGRLFTRPILDLLKEKRNRRTGKILERSDISIIRRALKKLERKTYPALRLDPKVFSERVGRRIERIFENDEKYRRTRDIDHIHRLRIDLKRLRYSLEQSQEFSPRFVPFLPSLKKMQDHLGHLHDLETFGELLKSVEKARNHFEKSALEGIRTIRGKARSAFQEDLSSWNRLWRSRKETIQKILTETRRNNGASGARL